MKEIGATALFATALVLALWVFLAGSAADAAPGVTETPTPMSDVADMPCRLLTQRSPQPKQMFAGLSGDLCDMVLNASACPVPTGRVFNGAAAGARVFVLPDEFFARFAELRALPDEPLALQRYDSALIREDTCKLTQADLFSEDDLDVRREIAVAHLIVIHELAHIVDYRADFMLSAALETADIERGLGHAHGANELKELFAFCATALQWHTNFSLPNVDAVEVRLATRGSASGMISWRCPSGNRATVNEILAAAGALPVDPYLTSPTSLTRRTNETLPLIEAPLCRDLSSGHANGVAGSRCLAENRDAVTDIPNSVALKPRAASSTKAIRV